MTKSLGKTPIPPEGQPIGSLDAAVQPQTGSQNSSENSVPIETSAWDSAVQAHLLGVPDTLPLTWCPHCKADVMPKGKGLCPRCSRFLKNSFAARKHPVN